MPSKPAIETKDEPILTPPKAEPPAAPINAGAPVRPAAKAETPAVTSGPSIDPLAVLPPPPDDPGPANGKGLAHSLAPQSPFS